jgi:hypothetical protein
MRIGEWKQAAFGAACLLAGFGLGLVAAAATLGGLLVLAGVERVAAGATGNGVRVMDGEPAAHEGIDEIDRGASQIHGAEIVDDDLDALGLDDLVAFILDLFDRHAVLEAGASAGGDEDAESVIGRALLIKEFLELLDGVISY